MAHEVFPPARPLKPYTPLLPAAMLEAPVRGLKRLQAHLEHEDEVQFSHKNESMGQKSPAPSVLALCHWARVALSNLPNIVPGYSDSLLAASSQTFTCCCAGLGTAEAAVEQVVAAGLSMDIAVKLEAVASFGIDPHCRQALCAHKLSGHVFGDLFPLFPGCQADHTPAVPALCEKVRQVLRDSLLNPQQVLSGPIERTGMHSGHSLPPVVKNGKTRRPGIARHLSLVQHMYVLCPRGQVTRTAAPESRGLGWLT